jgi:MoaA/NifB/PqqE/SkfB family radical SAM enzyme
MKILPYSVDFRINGNCNLECPFCFGPRHEIPPMPTDNALKVVDLIASYGAQAIVFTGGEPLLVKDIGKILKFAKSTGMKVVLSTNGTLIHDRLEEISQFVDWLAIPIDGSTSKENALSRVGNFDHLEIALSSIKLVRKKYPNIKIKVGTVVSAINKNNIHEIPCLFEDIMPDTWKIYEVSYSSYGNDNKDSLQIEKQEFDLVLEQLRTTHAFEKTNIEIYRNSSRNGKYFFVEPNGNIMTIVCNEEKVLGNILTDSKETIHQLCEQYIDKDLLKSNFKRTYS